jgi:YD repeat-containing protein
MGMWVLVLAAIGTCVNLAGAGTGICRMKPGSTEASQCIGTPPDTYYYSHCQKKPCQPGKPFCEHEGMYKVFFSVGGEFTAVGDPVIFPSGAYVEQKLDLEAGRLGESFAVVRYSSSVDTFTAAPLGTRWDTSLYPRISEDSSNATVYLGYTDPEVLAQTGGTYERAAQFTLTKIDSKFQIHYDNGAKIYFDTNKNAVSKVLSTGLTYQWVYSGSNVQTVKIGGTAVVTAMWQATPNRVTKVTNIQTGDTVAYTYTGTGDLTKVEGGCGSCSSGGSGAIYSYVPSGNGAGCIQEVKDLDENRQLKMVYDSSCRVLTQFRDQNETTFATYAYDAYGVTGYYAHKDFENIEKRIYLDSSGQITKNETLSGGSPTYIFEKVLDGGGNIIRQRWLVSIAGATTRWREERFNYDTANRMTMSILYEASAPITKTIRWYDESSGNITKETFAGNITTIYDYNNGLLLTKTVQAPGISDVVEWWVYDANSQEITYRNPNGVLEAYAYDADGNLATKTLDPGGLAIRDIYFRDGMCRVTLRKDPNGNEWRTYYGAGNQVTKEVAPNGLTTAYVYSSAGRLITQKGYDDGGSITRITAHVYDSWGRRVTTIDPAGGISTIAYDGNDREIVSTNPDGVKTGKVYNFIDQLTNELAWDGSGWVTKSHFYYDMEGNLTKQTDALGRALANNVEYDAYGRTTRTTDTFGNYGVVEYDLMGQQTRQVKYDSGNAALSEERTQYDGLGRVTRTRTLASPGGNISDTADAVSDTVYDAGGRVLTEIAYLTDAVAATKTFVYDNAGRVLTQTGTDAPTTAFVYDPAGHALT